MTVATFRWLGVNSLELQVDGYTLLIDPFLTRPPLRRLLANCPAASDEALLSRHLPRADAILVTHPHYDHLMDAPSLAKRTGAGVSGSANTCRLLAAAGVAANQIHEIKPGSRFTLGPFAVTPLRAWHTSTPMDRWLNGPLPARLNAPLRLWDFKMDVNYAFLLEAAGRRILVGSEPIKGIDNLFFAPYLPADRLERLLVTSRPRRVILTHWDNFFSPLNHPLRQVPLRVNLAQARRRIQSLLPDAIVLTPPLFAEQEL